MGQFEAFDKSVHTFVCHLYYILAKGTRKDRFIEKSMKENVLNHRQRTVSVRLSLGYVERVELVAVAIDKPPLGEGIVDAHVRKRALVVDGMAIVVRPVIEK